MKRLIQSVRVNVLLLLGSLLHALVRDGETCPCCWRALIVRDREDCIQCGGCLIDSETDVCGGCIEGLEARIRAGETTSFCGCDRHFGECSECGVCLIDSETDVCGDCEEDSEGRGMTAA